MQTFTITPPLTEEERDVLTFLADHEEEYSFQKAWRVYYQTRYPATDEKMKEMTRILEGFWRRGLLTVKQGSGSLSTPQRLDGDSIGTEQ
jgi:hypothetical protein